MNETLYLQLDQHIIITNPHVYLQDIASLSCSNTKTLNRLRVLPVLHLKNKQPGRYVMSVLDLVKQIQEKEPNLTITPVGEPDFIITYQTESTQSRLWRFAKAALVCVGTFFGAAFSIMTFNNDVDLPNLFSQLYTQVTGQVSSGFTVLEISYSIGVGLGVLLFFNHFGRLKLTDDPTPMQVKMRLYEDDVNNTIIEEADRIQSHQK